MPYKFKFEINEGTEEEPHWITSYEEVMNSTLCLGRTKTGARCRRKCIIGFEYCPSHLTSVKHLKIKPSTLEGAGKGLFAWDKTKENTNNPVFNPRDNIIDYHGKEKTIDEINEQYGEDNTAPYAVEYKQNQAIDSASKRGVASLANHKPRRYINAELVPKKDNTRRIVGVQIQATKRIFHGDEIFVNYGRTYRFDDDTRYSTKPYNPK